MSKFTKIVVAGKQIHKKYHEEIIALHKRFFDVDASFIINSLQERDEVFLYFDKKTNKIIGTIGIQWFDYNNFAGFYLGNAVIDLDYQKYGILTKCILLSTLKSFIYYPTKPKYCISFSATPDAYNYFNKLENYWPKPNEILPQNIKDILIQFCQDMESYDFFITEYALIIKNTVADFRAINHNVIDNLKPSEKNNSWFFKLNPDFALGNQIVCVTALDSSFNIKIFKTFLKRFRKLF